MTTTAVLMCSAANAETLQVYMSDGSLNIRNGPGTNYALMGAAPNGSNFTWNGPAYCVPRQDGIRGADWCKVNWKGQTGWVSRAGLMPVPDTSNGVSPDYMDVPTAEVFHCGQAQVQPPEYDPNPVMSTEITHNPNTHTWTIDHHMLNGQIASRQQQYALTDWPFGADLDDARWTGNLLRDQKIHMVGWIRYTNQGLFYEEQIYNRAHGDRMETRIVSRCQIVRQQAQAPLPVPQGTVIEHIPQYPPRVIPGTTWSPTPKEGS
jgi:uncharacterized protein YraI